MRAPEQVFIDTGAWIALALQRDPYHPQARASWESILASGTRLATSIPVVIETFTFLDRNSERDVALRWKESLEALSRFRVLECTGKDLARAWGYFSRRDFHKLSAVDATSFVLMARERIRVAFTFDRHFSTAGFRLLG